MRLSKEIFQKKKETIGYNKRDREIAQRLRGFHYEYNQEEFMFQLNGRVVVDFVLKPYFNRVRLGEGGLVVFNLFHSIYAHRAPTQIITEVTLAFLVMCALYGYNDFTDRQRDGLNEKKDKNFVISILQHPKFFLGVNLFLTIITLFMALLFFGTTKMKVLTLLYTVNFFYSKRFKSIPILDIIVVGMWGGLYVMLSGRFQWDLIFIVGIMTGMAHLFQIMTDKVSDGENKINTTIVALPDSELLFLAVLCFVLSWLLFFTLNIWWGGSALLPLFIYGVTKQVTFSWYVSRAYFFICWIALLTLFYGSL
ncbi:MAG: UbiA family prenyltransferase [Chitinophagales bacterium]